MAISKSEMRIWEREFPILKCQPYIGLELKLDKVSVQRMDANLMAATLRTNEYYCLAFGNKVDWIKGYLHFSGSYVELDVAVRGSSADGKRWEHCAPTIGAQLKDEGLEGLEYIVIISHDDGDYNGGLASTCLTVFKAPRKGAENLLAQYWAGVEKAIMDEIAKADIVG